MRLLLLTLPLALLPFAPAHANEHAHEHDHDEHASLDAHEHGSASLNIALEGNSLELELDSPAMNLLGFEHAAHSTADRAKLASVKRLLEQPQQLFTLPAAANCQITSSELHSPLFEDEHADEQHNDVEAHYQFSCANPQALDSLSLAAFFQQFAGMEKLQVQLISTTGQSGKTLTASDSLLPL
ncbi:hypothetical protein HNP49_002680 [Pseudomonas fluvialis]|uniref:DUF2796 domain-containing protein n=1 Tax=Pseudomonas fluvialis TaxID=1793966 RepID=A0A7X0ESP1_9PSED|nr:DUF2796 domain-containing protein [Pseudomonas fluvialis]MBB6342498.1 hypothetical protein [Pseudomonas fluvialis]